MKPEQALCNFAHQPVIFLSYMLATCVHGGFALTRSHIKGPIRSGGNCGAQHPGEVQLAKRLFEQQCSGIELAVVDDGSL